MGGGISKELESKVVSVGDDGVRNAGSIFNYKSKRVRPGQDCRFKTYGRGLVFFEVKNLSPYTEQEIYRFDYKEMQNHLKFVDEPYSIIGTHTYNSSDKYEVIDISYMGNLNADINLERAVMNLVKFCYHVTKNVKFSTKKYLKKVINHLNKYKEDAYEAIINKEAPYVFVSYIANPFYHRNDNDYLNYHQNLRETLAMADVFNKLGYNAFFMKYDCNKPLPDINCKLIFGHFPNIQRAKEKYKDAKVIYYGVSPYYEYRNNKIKEMTDEFNEYYHTKASYKRMVNPYDLSKVDAILLIGSDNTIKTFPKEYQKNITKIHQSLQECKYLPRLTAENTNEYLYVGGYGNILKGIMPVIEYFKRHQKLILHLVGPIEEDVKIVLKTTTPNIHIYGYQSMNSDLFLGLAERCNFTIYTSGVEGVPGSVLNCMRNGLIPLTTKIASFDEIKKYGYVMDDGTEAEIDKAIKWSLAIPDVDILKKKKECQKFVLETYNLNRFTKEFENYMKKWL